MKQLLLVLVSVVGVVFIWGAKADDRALLVVSGPLATEVEVQARPAVSLEGGGSPRQSAAAEPTSLVDKEGSRGVEVGAEPPSTKLPHDFSLKYSGHSYNDIEKALEEVGRAMGLRHYKRMQYEVESGRGEEIDPLEFDATKLDQTEFLSGSFYSKQREARFRVDIPVEEAEELVRLRDEVAWLHTKLSTLKATAPWGGK